MSYRQANRIRLQAVVWTVMLLASTAGCTSISSRTTYSPIPTGTPRPTSSLTATLFVEASVTETLTPEPTHTRSFATPTRTRTSPSTWAETPVPTFPIKETEIMTLTVVYDNNPYDPACKTAWGFACLIETAQATVLFDTGGDGPTLLGNMDELGIDPASIDLIALSHIHGDHTGGLIPLLDTGIHPVVYAPAAFSTFFKSDVRARTELVEVTDPMRLAPSIHTTGEVGTRIVEQALIVETSRGAIVITGCAHPGIVNMVQRAHKTVPGEIDLVMGGFHLGNASRKQIDQIIHELEVLGVHRAAPSHCTGERAREMFAHAFGESFVPIGAGAKITVEP